MNDITQHLASVLEALEDEHDAFVLFSRSPDEHQRRHHKGHHEYADVLLRKYRAAIDAAISEDIQKDDSPYGRCPQCGALGVSRERRINGYTRCENGHAIRSVAWDLAQPITRRVQLGDRNVGESTQPPTEVSQVCPTCGGSGKQHRVVSNHNYTMDCPTCQGTGSVKR